MAPELPTTLAGEQVLLLGARALYWPARKALLIADLHLGKADVFRRAGIGLPSGGTGDDLDRLSALLHQHAVDTLWILGDVLHGAAHRAAWYRQWQGWREQHATLEIAPWPAITIGHCPRPISASRCSASNCRWGRFCCATIRTRTRHCM